MAKEKAQLHQLLAVEPEIRKNAAGIIQETKKLFSHADYFDGLIKAYVPIVTDEVPVPSEEKKVVTTVPDRLNYTMESVIKSLNAVLSKETTNSSGATALLKIGEKTFGEFSPTALLAMEQQLSQIKEVYLFAPTLDNTKSWEPDTEAGPGFLKTPVTKVYRSLKKPKAIVKYPATKEHPAQTEMVMEDVHVGDYETTYYTGRITSAQKHELLTRVDNLLQAVKRARAQANQAEVIDVKVGKDLIDYIHGDTLK